MSFLSENPENGDFNQYWYSSKTIATIVEELEHLNGRIAFLSTPSLYFSLPLASRQNCYVFDYDKKWLSDRGFVFYDFNTPENIPEEMLHTFDVVVIDPPFITHEVWKNYATTTKLLLKEGTNEEGHPHGKVIGTTVIENSPLLADILNLSPTNFQPSIPNLVYQYHLFTNYSSQIFSNKNPEIPD